MAKNKKNNNRKVEGRTKSCSLCTPYQRIPSQQYAAHMAAHAANARKGRRGAQVSLGR
jgi:hypothetical protein